MTSISLPIYIDIIAVIFGLIIGSFLTVVTTRYPAMLQRQWRAECREFLKLDAEPVGEKLSLALPRSHCPQCKSPLKGYHNIPLLSYLFLRGKCANCRARIPLLYPALELLCALTTWIIVYHFGLNWTMLACLLFTYALIAMSVIDLQHKILPDTMTLPMLWIGLMLNTQAIFIGLNDALWATVIGYLLLWITAWGFYLIRKKQGMGHGDFKMLAMVGAWLGINPMINSLLVAVIIGVLVGLFAIIAKRSNWQKAIPFGPFIAIGAWLTLLFGPFIFQWLGAYQ